MTPISPLKKLLCLGVAFGSLIAGPALAADPLGPAGNWMGPYVGGFVGGAWSSFYSGNGIPGPTGDDRSFTGGGNIGDDFQYGHVVIGGIADFGTLDNHSGAGGVKFTEDWMSTIRARAGFSFDRFLPYVTAGLALTDDTSKVSGVGRSENVQPGMVVGGGIDAMLQGNWFGRLEYLYVDVPKNQTTIGNTVVAGGSGNNIVRLGVGYKF